MGHDAQQEKTAGDTARRKPDRRLGDEWADWDGHLDGEPAVLDEDRRVFIGFAFLCLVVLIAALGAFFYMIYPRLEGWHEYLAQGVMATLGAFSLAVLLWFSSIAFPLLTGIRLPWRMDSVQKSMNLLIPLTIRLGRTFGISRDRMGNSFIKVSNALVRGARINTDSGPLLMLLPRCLAPQVRKQIQALGERYECLVHVVPGGELARKLIHENRPSRIIAVACERDLVSGIQDMAPIIPTYAVPNCRPEGPCKNTVVDMEKMEEAMILFSPRRRD
ncbi:MAG: DUF116 domain-containing protein [Candidatus Glassbacteria bacterium]|nr:DUF116 domain-containing protein [Candidatus Glassbacteria bacterium]